MERDTESEWVVEIWHRAQKGGRLKRSARWGCSKLVKHSPYQPGLFDPYGHRVLPMRIDLLLELSIETENRA